MIRRTVYIWLILSFLPSCNFFANVPGFVLLLVFDSFIDKATGLSVILEMVVRITLIYPCLQLKF